MIIFKNGYFSLAFCIVSFIYIPAWPQSGQVSDLDELKVLKLRYLESIQPSKEKIQRFIGKVSDINGYNPNAGWFFDKEMGWILKDAVRYDGVDTSKTYYHYDKNGARRRVNFPNRKARIHTYGNSFTHCDQVNDGETWQEYLAAHLQEPIENFGIGGYSVYQAYLRMKKIEISHPAEYIILNIYDDDHFRNLESWWSIRHSKTGFCSFTMPHVQVNVEKDEIIEVPNPCQTSDDVYKLLDSEWLLDTFGHDPILGIELFDYNVPVSDKLFSQIVKSFGITSTYEDGMDIKWEVEQIYSRAALFSTIKILEKIDKFVRAKDRKLMVILSYSRKTVSRYLAGEDRFDTTLLDYLKTRDYPFIDLLACHFDEYKSFKLDINSYIQQYYIGHYNPRGNFFSAFAIRREIVNWLNPKPKPYFSESR